MVAGLLDLNLRTDPAQGRASEVGRRIAAQIPNLFGRLVFLHSLRDTDSGRYSHPLLLESFGPEVADRTLHHTHHQAFMEWLRLSLAEQKEDVDDYLRMSGSDVYHLCYRELVPVNAHQVERQLYLTDLEVVLQLISFE